MPQWKPKLTARLASLLELPGEVLSNSCRVTLLGNERLMVENHRGLLFYSGAMIVLQTPAGRLRITGADLNIGAIAPDQVSVDGLIVGLKYLDGGS
jgi:sporulation protein YqfC